MSDQNNLSGRVGLETTDFKTGLATMNRELRVLESSFRASAAGLGDWAKDASGLELRIKSLSGQIDVQKQKVGALEAEYKKVAEEKGENSRAAQELEIKLNKETETLGKMESELGKTEKALSEMGDETGDTAKSTDKLEDEENQATSATKRFADAMHGLKGKLGDAAGGLKNMIGGIAKVTAGIAVGLAGAVAGAAAGIGALVLKTAATSDELVEMSDKVGIGVEQLQELKYIGEQTGTGVEAVTGSLARMIRGMGDAARGTGTAKDAFKDLGVEILDSNGNLRDSQVVFSEALEALGQVGNETERDALAMQIFGRSAQELNPLIAAGADGMAQMAQQARDMGAVMGEDTVVGMAALNDSIAGLKLGFQGIIGTLAAEFLPIVNEVVKFIQDVVVPWLKEHLPLAIEVLKRYWSEVLLPAIQAVWNWMSTVLIPFLQNVVFPWLQENIPKALKTLSDFWKNVLQPAIQAVWNWMKTVLIPFLQNTVYPWLQENIPKAIQTLSDFWTNVLKPALETVWDFLVANVVPILEEVWEWLSTNLPPAIKMVSDFFTQFFLPVLSKVWDFIKTNVIPIISDLVGWFADKLMPAISNLVSGPLSVLKAAFLGVRDAISWVIDKVLSLISKLAGIELPEFLQRDSPSPFEQTFLGANEALAELTQRRLPALGRGLNSLPGAAGNGGGGGSVQNTWSYVIQAASPLQTTSELVREVRLLEMMHS